MPVPAERASEPGDLVAQCAYVNVWIVPVTGGRTRARSAWRAALDVQVDGVEARVELAAPNQR
jgi:hypothetical protein